MKTENYAIKMSRLSSQRRKPIIIKVFEETDLRCGHKGLGLLARKSNIDIAKLPAGEFILFINKDGTAIKLLANGNIMVHLKTATSEQIEMKVIEMLPRFFNGNYFDFNKAAQLGLEDAA